MRHSNKHTKTQASASAFFNILQRFLQFYTIFGQMCVFLSESMVRICILQMIHAHHFHVYLASLISITLGHFVFQTTFFMTPQRLHSQKRPSACTACAAEIIKIKKIWTKGTVATCHILVRAVRLRRVCARGRYMNATTHCTQMWTV
jgi:hypothetical protein